MIKFDFETYTKNHYNITDLKILLEKQNNIEEKIKENSMAGWLSFDDDNLINDIKETAKKIKETSTSLVVIGIGGSYLGSYSINEMFKSYFNDSSFEIIYAGISLSSEYLSDLLNYLKDKDFTINVISKSGTTMEPTIAYKKIKELLEQKYSKEEVSKRIIITTDKQNGTLREEVIKEGYKSFEIPSNIGGRYSLMTAAHLLPLALNIDIEKLVKGYNSGKELIKEAFHYASLRKVMYNNKKLIENYSVYENKMYYYTEFLKQLFGETEGKEEVGIFPVSTVNTRDLHSLGQFIQEGTPIIFETLLRINQTKDIEINNLSLNKINYDVSTAVSIAHTKGKTPTIVIEIDRITEENIGQLSYFFFLSAAFSGFLFNIDPFNQPGVEVYKEEVRNNVKLDF